MKEKDDETESFAVHSTTIARKQDPRHGESRPKLWAVASVHQQGTRETASLSLRIVHLTTLTRRVTLSESR